MDTARLTLWIVALGCGCSTRGGYAEPGPLSANASPPAPASIQSSGALQTSPATGRQGEGPMSVNAGGAQVADDHRDHGRAQTPATECATDADCVAATCCHATACVPSARAPVCGGMACTADCAPNSLDCNQGSCACVSGHCGIIRPTGR
ncbi:MAG: hypothetical protein U0326_31895 [Polyangiales bacterium]